MPIDSSIYQNRGPSLADSLMKIYQMKDLADQKKLRDAGIKENKSIKEAYGRNVVTNENGMTSLNKEGLINDLYRINPEKATQAQQGFSAQARQAKKNQMSDFMTKINMTGQLLGAATDQPTYEKSRAMLIQHGIMDENELPAQYDKNLVTGYQNQAMTMAERFQKQFKEREFSQKDRQLSQKERELGIKSREKKKERSGALVQGLDIVEGAQPTVDDAKKVKAALVQKDNILNSLKKLDSLVDEHGTEAFSYGTASQSMGQLATDARMGAKDLYELGVLTGPDMDLLESVIPDPSDLSWAVTPNATEKVKVKLKKAMEIINQKAGNIIKTRGYAQKDQNEDQQETKEWEGVTYKKIGDQWVAQ